MFRDEHVMFVYHNTWCRVSSSGLVSRESKNIPQLQNKEVIYSSNDGQLLLLLHQNFNASEPLRFNIWKPITDESIELPDGPHGVKFDKGQALISSSPGDPNCLVVYLFREDSPSLLYCRVGDDEGWSEYNYGTSIEAQKPRCEVQAHPHICGQLHQPVSMDGRVYALYTCGRDLVQVSVDASNICTTNVLQRKKERMKAGCYRYYLMPWGDHEIYRITIFLAHARAFKYNEIPDIIITKYNFQTNGWNLLKKKSLEGGRVFLGNRYSLTSSSSTTRWSCIYFTSEDDKVLHSYMLEDEKVTSYSPYSPDLPGPWLPHWIMPAQTKTEPEFEAEHEDNIYKLEDGHGNEERNNTVDNESAGLYDLMPDLIWLIAEKLVSFVDYIHFLSINIRVWNDVRIMREKTFQPCLIYRDKVKQQYHIIDGSLDRKLTIKIPEALKGKKIKCSKEGWLVAYNLSSCALFNPFTSQLVIAEDPNTKQTNCGISNFTIIGKPSPSSPQNCSVLAMSLINSTHSYMVKSGGGSEPRKAEWWRLVLKRKKFTPCCVSPVLLGEDFYHLACNNGRLGRLQILDLKQGKFEWEEIEELESPCSHFTRNYLTECGGDLVSVFIGDELEVSWVRVFKINGAKKEWQEIDSLRGYSLYVGRPSCMSCVAEMVEISDRIYFPKFYKHGLVYYSLKSKKFYSIGNNRDEVTRFHPTTMFSDCAWINPNLSN